MILTSYSPRTLIAATMTLGVLLGTACTGQLVRAKAGRGAARLEPAPGSKVTIAITSDLVDWEMVSSSIEGSLEVRKGFPIEPGEQPAPGDVQATATAWVPVLTLKSTRGGKPFSDAWDSFAYERLRADKSPKVVCVLKEFVLKQAARSREAPHQYQAKGHIVIAGVTNEVSVALSVLPLDHSRLRISGRKTLRMTDFGMGLQLPGIVDPPTAKLHNDVEVSFEWVLSERH